MTLRGSNEIVRSENCSSRTWFDGKVVRMENCSNVSIFFYTNAVDSVNLCLTNYKSKKIWYAVFYAIKCF